MTREEAIKELKEDIELYIPLHGTIDDVDRDLPDGRLITALEMAIKALEQEPCDVFDEYGNYKYPGDVELTEPNTATSMPCEDTISRSDMLDAIGHGTTYTSEGLQSIIKGIPPVNPQPKTGHWIDEIDDYGKVIWWHCDKCYEDSGFTTDCKWKYCPNCGAKMVEPQETETWNGIHAPQITAPKGTFERIFNDADDDNDI